ncbi:MAG TPA: DnaJ domain-containing protein [Polyangiaceae bacterium]|nr:DnaJ domain-containing protein [Polyangiaceae bacterium]
MSDARARTPELVPEAAGEAAPAAAAERQPPEDVDLDVEMRKRVLETQRNLERQDHYALLGVDRRADAKDIKRAYYQLAATFHPDRYFRRRLGSFKPRMEAIFGRLTLAYETLSDAEKRQEYDAYLEEQRRTRGIEQLLADAIAEAKRAEESIEREVRSQTPLAAPAGIGSSAPPPAPAAPTTPAPVVDHAARRDALARRLLGGRSPTTSSAPPPRPSLTPPPMPTVADAMDALRRRYEERVERAKAAQARKYVTNAEAALAAGDAVAAANAFRVALSLSPADPDLEDRARSAQAKADDVLSDAYARQAAYEEKTGQWVAAARSWARVCKARLSDAHAHERAANAITKAGGDLHEASRLAAHACALEPANPRYRVVLANVYLAAGLALNARRELETAAQLAPHDGTIAEMMRKVGR